MSSLFILGNGFDIAHGIPTKYSDFRSFIIKLYPESLKFRDRTVSLQEAANMASDEFAAEILLNTLDKVAGKDWCDFEDALAYTNFNNKLPLPNHGENETDEEDHELMKDYLLYMDVLTSGFINCTKLWQDFFRIWLKDVQGQIDNNQFNSKDVLTVLFSQPDAQFLTFNYTKTLQRLYGIKKVIHIHNRVGQKLIFGHGRDNVVYDQFSTEFSDGPHLSSSMLDDMIMSFRKDTESPFKKYDGFFRKLNRKVDKIYSYGFSYAKVDSVYIKRIISKIAPDATWLFSAFEAQSPEALRIKKIKLRKYGFKGTFDIYTGC